MQAFLGVPYAAPPVGALRWVAPQPATAWKDVRNATEYGQRCAQIHDNWAIIHGYQDPGESEDCLYLDVYTHVLLVRYPNEADAQKALAHFQRVYLSGKLSASTNTGVVSIEDGWTGFTLSGKGLALVFEGPDESLTRLFLRSAKQALDNVEAIHE